MSLGALGIAVATHLYSFAFLNWHTITSDSNALVDEVHHCSLPAEILMLGGAHAFQ